MRSFNDTADLPVCHSDVLPAHHSKTAAYPTGAQFSGFYSKLRHDVVKTHQIPTVPIAALIHHQTARQASHSPKSPTPKPVITETPALLQISTTMSPINNSIEPVAEELEELSRDAQSASSTTRKENGISDPIDLPPATAESLNNALVKLTDVDGNILSVVDSLRILNLLVKSSGKLRNLWHFRGDAQLYRPRSSTFTYAECIGRYPSYTQTKSGRARNSSFGRHYPVIDVQSNP